MAGINVAGLAIEALKFVPGIGTPICIATGLSKLAKGNFIGAGLDFIGAIPAFGQIARGLGLSGRLAALVPSGVKTFEIAKFLPAAVKNLEVMRKVDTVADLAAAGARVAKGINIPPNIGTYAKLAGTAAAFPL